MTDTPKDIVPVTDAMIEAGLMHEHGIEWGRHLTENERHSMRSNMHELLSAAFAAQPTPQVNMTGWQPMETAPKDGKHCILSIPTGSGFIYSIQGAFMNGKWMNAANIDAEPLAWMPNVLLPDELCPWTDVFKTRAATTEGM